jgi:hypothetical protein
LFLFQVRCWFQFQVRCWFQFKCQCPLRELFIK